MPVNLQEIFNFKRIRSTNIVLVYKNVKLMYKENYVIIDALKELFSTTGQNDFHYLIQIRYGNANVADLYIYVELSCEIDISYKEKLTLNINGEKYLGISSAVPPKLKRLALMCVLKASTSDTKYLHNFEGCFVQEITDMIGHCFEDVVSLNQRTDTVEYKEKFVDDISRNRKILSQKNITKIIAIVKKCYEILKKSEVDITKQDKTILAKQQSNLAYYRKNFIIPNDLLIHIENCKSSNFKDIEIRYNATPE